MASMGVSALAGAGIAPANPILGFAIAAAAAVIDSQGIYPALMGKGKQAARPPRLHELPRDPSGPGAERIWAIGRRVRVPVHTLWQDFKVRESGLGSAKAGTQVNQRKTYFDALFALNDRKTHALTHLVGNGKLLL